jgi:hypothetical protein
MNAKYKSGDLNKAWRNWKKAIVEVPGNELKTRRRYKLLIKLKHQFDCHLSEKFGIEIEK